jgi:NAD(P)-dependent dehydrogenase (short-subunit alcohol dehydrogenase family)
MKRYDGKTILVTGAGQGIGFGLCRAFAAEGAIVALNDMQADLAAQAAQKINDELGEQRVYAYACDVSDVQAVRQMFADFVGQFKRLDVTFANAGITNYGRFLDYSPEAFDRLMGVNLRGSYFTAQTAAHYMIDQRIEGRILLMSSITGLRAFLNLGGYGITKAGIRMMAQTLALELGRYGITVNAISPGATLTERTLQDDPAFEANWASVTPTGRPGYVEDVVAAALFLASPEARHITGQTIQVDGGWTIHSPLPQNHPDMPDYSSQLR